jgi:hypothetical protein
LAGGLEKKSRVRSGEHPDPGGLFPLAKQTGEEISGWQRIGSFSGLFAELSGTSSYSPSCLFIRCPATAGSGGAQRRNSQSLTSASYERTKQPFSLGQGPGF